jgi:hypothetical protein
MKLNDPVIGASFLAIENSLKMAVKRVKPISEKPADKQCAEMIAESLDDMSTSWADTMDYILEMLLYGCSPMEIVYKRRFGPNPPPYTKGASESKYSDGLIGWRKWAPRSILTLTEGDEFELDETGGVQGFNQQNEVTGARVFIPIERGLLFRTTVTPMGTPFGMPVHRSSYTSYYFTRNFQEIEGIMVERDGAGIPIVYLGEDCTMNGSNSDFELAKDLVVNLRQDEQAGIVVPHAKMGHGAAEGRGMLVELLSSSGQRAHNVGDIIKRYDDRKALSMLTQFLMLGLSGTGSYALARTQGDLFTVAVSAWLQKIADVINRYAIPRLIRYNMFPKITGYPEMVFSDVGIPDLNAMALFVNSLVGRNVITPDPELERHLRQLAHLPEAAPVKVNSGNVKTKPILETALTLRRALLALKELPDTNSLADEQLASLVQPLVAQLTQGIEESTGQKITVAPQATTQPNVDQIITQLTKT